MQEVDGTEEGHSEMTAFVPINKFLIPLAEGWRFSGDIAEPLQCHHGVWSCIMWKAE